MKKGDFLVIGSILAAALLLFCGISLFSRSSADVTVSENNKIVYSGSINTDKTVRLAHNTVVIKDGYVYMDYSDCKNKICVKHKKISRAGESIICLPNKVIIVTN